MAWKLSAAQDGLIAAKTDVVKPHQLLYWTPERWTPGKRLDPGGGAGLIAGDGTLLYFLLDPGNLAQALKPVPFGAPVIIDCEIQKGDLLWFRVRWTRPKKPR
jgi:hypothetical protein